jgi:BirA family biotin operon repressor/biotin-[acetyl-CoA-carboxylase] ligase
LYKIPVDTLFLGKNLVILPECPSTNTLAAEMSQTGGPNVAGEGTVIITHHQTVGRGQRGNTWESGKGLNLTFSVILHPTFLRVTDQFQLNKAVALAVHDVVKNYAEDPRVKWPNDIMIGNKKVCGMLIENQVIGEKISRSIVGIGLNVNQKEFSSPAASSVSIYSGKEIDLARMFDELMKALEWRYLQLRSQEAGLRSRESGVGSQESGVWSLEFGVRSGRLDGDYLEVLYGMNEVRKFVINDTETDGIIRGVDDHGKLVVEINDAVRSFDLKEIKFVI